MRWPALVPLLALLGAGADAAQDWPQFRGPDRDGASAETGLLKAWPEDGPKVLWTAPMCEGYSGAAIFDGRVFYHDYDREKNEWLVRCVALEDGGEHWQFRESRRIRPNHGITRTVPAVDGAYVFSFDPKCVLHCLSAEDGTEVWSKNVVAEYEAMIPPWYNGQCPLIEEDRVLIAPGGNALVVALDKATGNELWRTPNPAKEPMSHVSLMPATFGGVRQYVYATLMGLKGIAADDGRLLWETEHKFNVAVAPSPLPVDGERLFVTSGYDAGSAMYRVSPRGEAFEVERLFSLSTNQWNSEVHTPIVHDGHLFAVGKKRRGLFTCMDLDGNVVWESDKDSSFGLGSFLLVDGGFLVLDGDSGLLRLIEASTEGYRELARAQVLSGGDVWAPMAYSRGRLVLRDMTHMICLDLAAPASDPERP